jgi:hypothetical protein
MFPLAVSHRNSFLLPHTTRLTRGSHTPTLESTRQTPHLLVMHDNSSLRVLFLLLSSAARSYRRCREDRRESCRVETILNCNIRRHAWHAWRRVDLLPLRRCALDTTTSKRALQAMVCTLCMCCELRQRYPVGAGVRALPAPTWWLSLSTNYS